MKRITYVLLLIMLPAMLSAQVGIGTTTPDESAALHIKSSTKGLLIPRVPDLTAVNGSTPARGLLVYVEADDKFYVYDSINTTWQCVNPLETNTTEATIRPGQPYESFEGNGTIPVGGIIMWTGTTPPAGWALCNGFNGTPDLRGRFIVGYADNNNTVMDDDNYPGAYPPGTYWNSEAAVTTYNQIGNPGGANSTTLSVNNMPTHTHNVKSVQVATPAQGGEAAVIPYGALGASSAKAISTVGNTGIELQNTGGVYTAPATYPNPPPYASPCTIWEYTCTEGVRTFSSSIDLSSNPRYITFDRESYRGVQAYTLKTYTTINGNYVEASPDVHGYCTSQIYPHIIVTSCTRNSANGYTVDGTAPYDCANPDHVPGVPVGDPVSTGSGSWRVQPINNRPPYYVMAFIMRIR